MLRRSLSSLLCVWAVVTVQPAIAADNPLQAFPDTVGVVVRLKKPQATIEKVAAMVDSVQQGAGGAVRVGGNALGAMISNPTREGVDMNADWWVGVVLKAEAEPALVFAIPAKDADTMKEALGEEVTFVKFEKWGVYTDNAEVGEAIKAQAESKKKSIADLINKESMTAFDQGDLSAFINIGELTKTYSEQIKSGKEQIQQALENVPQQGGAGFNTEAMMGMYVQIMDGVIQGLEDTENCTLAVGVSKTGITIEEHAKVTSGSETAKYLAKHTGSNMSALNLLPSTSLIYFGFHGDMKSIMSWSMSMMKSMFADDEDALKNLESVIADYQKLEFGTMVGAMEVGSLNQGALRTVTVAEVKEPKKIQELTRKLMSTMGELEIGGIKQTYDFKADSEKVGKYSADVLTVTQEFSEDAPGAEMQEKLMTAFYGPEGMTTRTVYLKDRMVQTLGGGKAAMTKALQTVEAPPSTTAAASPAMQTRKKLGDMANVLVLFDLPGIAANAIRVMQESGEEALPIKVDEARLKSITSKQTFGGFSLTLEPQAVKCRTLIPIEQLQGLAKVGGLFMPQPGQDGPGGNRP